MVYTENEPIYKIGPNGLTTCRIDYTITELIPGDKKHNKMVAVIYRNKTIPKPGYKNLQAGFHRENNGTEVHGYVIYEEIA